MSRIPRNEQEFNELMKSVDDALIERGVPIEARPLLAAGDVADILQIDVPIVGVEHATPGVFVDKSLGAHINAWYVRRYGERLKVDFSVGQAVLLVKGNPYRLIVPRIYGSPVFAIDGTLEPYPNRPIFVPSLGERRLVINVLTLIRGLTEDLVAELNDTDYRQIIDTVGRTATLFHRLASSSFPLQGEPLADLRVAVDSIVSSQPAYGLSRWSSLQFSEKLMKSLLRKSTQNVPFTHELRRLDTLLRQHGLPTVPTKYLDVVQCSADVRYDNSLVAMGEAILAHHMSLNIAAELLNVDPPFPKDIGDGNNAGP